LAVFCDLLEASIAVAMKAIKKLGKFLLLERILFQANRADERVVFFIEHFQRKRYVIKEGVTEA
jgi:hypothetical protein